MGQTENLVGKASEGDDAAMRELLSQQFPVLLAYVRLHAGGLIREKESCADIVQSVCLDVLQDLSEFEYRGDPSFRKWLFTKAMGKIRDRQRFYLAERRHPKLEEAVRSSSETGLAGVYASFCTPSQVAIRNEELEVLEEVFQQLPEDYKTVISLSRLMGYSHEEIAIEMNRKEGAVRVLLHRALAKLGCMMTAIQANDGSSR